MFARWMFWICFLAMMLTGCVVGRPADVLLLWEAPTENEDGTPLTDLAGYKIVYWRADHPEKIAIDVGNVVQYVFTATSGVQYFVVCVAYDDDGNEAEPSNEISFIFPILPTGQKNVGLFIR